MTDAYSRQLVSALSDGEFHSGESLGAELGISRAAIWKRLQALGQQGVLVESVKGLGYRVPGGLVLLNTEVIVAGMSLSARPYLSRLSCFDLIHSTNDYLTKEATSSGEVCIAERQSAGRGRRGRTWFSPFGKNIYMSVCWCFDGGVAALDGLSLAVGVIVAETLVDMGVEGVQLKWPNDLLLNNNGILAKLGGILVEVGGDLTGECKVVIGLGLNVALSDVLPTGDVKEVDQPWTDLKLAGYGGSRNQLLAELLSRLLPGLNKYHEEGFKFYRQRWLTLNAYQNSDVILKLAERETGGEMLGVDDKGALVLGTENGPQVFNGGEVSLRLNRRGGS